MAYEINWFDKAKEDYANLDGSPKIQVDKGITRIKRDGMKAGKSLNGNLSKCREIKHKKIGIRIIFKESDVDNTVEVIDIIVIGGRADKKAYKEADDRLNDE